MAGSESVIASFWPHLLYVEAPRQIGLLWMVSGRVTRETSSLKTGLAQVPDGFFGGGLRW